MRRLFFATLVLCCSPVRAFADTAPPAQPFAQLAGTWSCHTAAGSVVSSTFTTSSSGDVVELYDWNVGTQSGAFKQTFNYDAVSASWHVVNRGSGIFFDGTTSGQDGDAIEITGKQTINGQTGPEREQILLRSPTSFWHVWEVQAPDKTWRPTSFAECTLVQRNSSPASDNGGNP